ncbi:MAG: bifunctional phosphoribosyl-AMP cyclohydrolase/phosphoribosyl-ATP diphosphatase HisIE [Saprospiraceae bacterium]|nr:bifunctional phosphoribosyl-AMP cyclohydrolase/phosphoribosyl-ATP diphosphatase HisIE [Pyrinomonadaceae bacterium]
MDFEFNKYADGLVPAIIQDSVTGQVLMLGFMNEAALKATRETGFVTFYSRSRQTLWKKGETSGNTLRVEEILADCDQDTILVKATPAGPVCHTGAQTCFGENTSSTANRNLLFDLEKIIQERRLHPREDSYTAKLFSKGINKIAQKVGEEAVELVIEAKDDDVELFKSEGADLMFHFLVLLRAKDVTLDDILLTLAGRKKV